MRGNTGREKTNDREFRLCSRTSGNVLLPQVILLLCIYTRILVPRGIVACMLSLLSMLTSGSHKDLPDCICHLFTMLYLFNSLLSFIPFIHFHSFLSFLPLYLKICVCLIQFVLSSFFYPVYSCLYREISCRSPRAFSTQAIHKHMHPLPWLWDTNPRHTSSSSKDVPWPTRQVFRTVH